MDVAFRTDDVPVTDRFPLWRDLSDQVRGAVAWRTDAQQAAAFRGEVRGTDVGGMRVFSGTSTPYEVRRTPKLIRQSDPEHYIMVLGVRGRAALLQEERQATLGPTDLLLYDTSRPFDGLVGPDGNPTGLTTLAFPHALLPLHPNVVRRLTAVRLPAATGIGALVARALTDLGQYAATWRPARDMRLATAALDLVAALLADALEDDAALPAETHRRVLLHQIHAFIQQHLGDPDLTPDTIAAAHHISRRNLDKLFHEQAMTVAGWIRERRLDRCRRDLADPALAYWSIGEIATRWGLNSRAHFSRVFRAAYGVSPRDYRQLHRKPPAAE